jgi:osmotically-inducible protein OsmY
MERTKKWMDLGLNRPSPKEVISLGALYYVLIVFSVGLEIPASADTSQSKEASLIDTQLQTTLRTIYIFNRHLDSYDIDISVANHVVELQGQVESGIERDLAGEIAKSIDGVEVVKNNIEVAGDAKRRTVRNPLSAKIDDLSTVTAVRSKLNWNRYLHEDEIVVSAKDGVVTLSGSVNGSTEKDLAKLLTRNTPGVRRVENNLLVRQPDPNRVSEEADNDQSDRWIETRVKATLLFSSEAIGSDLWIDVREGIVILNGQFHNVEQRKNVHKLISDLKGVQNIVDNTRIEK